MPPKSYLLCTLSSLQEVAARLYPSDVNGEYVFDTSDSLLKYVAGER